MCYYHTLDSLPSFGIKEINQILRSGGHSLSEIDSLPPGSWDCVKISPLSFCVRNTWTGERRKGNEINILLRRDTEGLYMESRYMISLRGETEERRLRYYLVRKESNLLPGTYRYYFLDPYSEGLCSKLYYYPESGDFLPRSVLSSSGVLYSLQRMGHLERYYFGGSSRVPTQEELRHRKTHYRGKITPFQARYRKLREEEDRKLLEYLVGKGYAKGILPPDLEKEVSGDFRKHSGRKDTTGREKSS